MTAIPYTEVLAWGYLTTIAIGRVFASVKLILPLVRRTASATVAPTPDPGRNGARARRSRTSV